MRTRLNAASSKWRPGQPGIGRRLLAGTASAVVVLGGLSAAPATAANLDGTASLAGATGTTAVGGTLYAKTGGQLTLTITTTDDTKCVSGVPANLVGVRDSSIGKKLWTFTGPAAAGNDGLVALTVAAATGNSGGNDRCNGSAVTRTVSYVLDNTGPVVNGTLTPAPVGGWNNSDVTVRWTATDSGAGVAAAQPFQTDTVTSEGMVTKTAPAQADRLGNLGQPGSVTVSLDKTAPTITATMTSGGWGTPTTVTFTCTDATSGVASCLADGETTNAKTITGDGTVTGTATDKAGNTKTLSVPVKNVDTTPPTLSGAPTTQPNGKGWYNGDVTVHWTAADAESGIPTVPSDTTITSEGLARTSSTSVTNGAGLTTSATSSPAVNIDKTAPVTGIGGTSNQWTNGAVTVQLSASDSLSDVDFTTYTVDGGPTQKGNTFTLSTEGVHTIDYYSTDNAGNVEAGRTAEVKIDKTNPTIGHSFSPAGYTDGAWINKTVTVTFTCADQGGSLLADCTSPVTVGDEGKAQGVLGTARDNAGNVTTDAATVSIDKTAPTVHASTDRAANAAGWYDGDVTVSFASSDGLSGVASAPANVVLHQGENQSASGTATDGAGNTASDSVTGINIDKTKPELTGTFSAGWHTGNVTVHWTCTDALSGVVAQPEDSLVTGEGDNLSSTTTCTDKAGNSISATVTGIKIDRHAPTTTASAEGQHQNGWYGEPVSVTLEGSDNLFDNVSTFYSVDGGAEQTYSGPFTYGTEGTHSISFWSQDGAGNIEDAGLPLELKIDTTAPTTSKTYPISTGSGWYAVSGIPFAFAAQDGADRSGVAATYFTIDGQQHDYTELYTAKLSTGSHDITFWSVDVAGNVEGEQSFVVKVDTIAPDITGAQSPAANKYGWNNTNVEVKFTCSDRDSGIDGVAGCAGDTILKNDGAGQTVRGDAVDVAGNRSTTDFGPVNIDTVKPTLNGVPEKPNAAGWYNDDVVVTWVGDDALSLIDPASQPAPSTITGEGSNLGAGPVTIKDKAGNVSDAATVSGIRIDRTPPVITGAPTAQPNAAGWYKDAVTVKFTCLDSLSGMGTCPSNEVISGDGGGQSVTGGSAFDLAGNEAAGKTVGGINVDGTAPTTTANNQCTKVNGWCTGKTANVVLTATDQAGLSGVKEIHYRIDGGAEQTAAGASKTVSVPLDGSGEGNVSYWAVDNAGNAEPANAVALKWDNIAPTVTHSLTPNANADGWNMNDVTVHFSAKDDDSGSGVDTSTITGDVVVRDETGGRVVNGSAADFAGNLGTDTVTVMLDKTQPTITASVSGKKGDNGWYVGPVTVSFTCGDALSGVAVCPKPVTLTDNGTGQGTTSTAVDKAGNTASASVSGINIDQELPTLTARDVNVAGAQYTLGTVPTASCTAVDNVSGLASCKVTVTGGNANGVGSFNYTATAKDNAGNTTTITGTYNVIYRWDGFLQPINDTAHQIGTSTSIFKAGSTVPVKFQLRNTGGAIVQASSAPGWMSPVMGSTTKAAVDETAYAASADSGSDFRYDATAQQYIYNWKTPSAGGNYWRIGVMLDDGQTYYVNIGLR